MNNDQPIRYRKSVALREERARLIHRRDYLRQEWLDTAGPDWGDRDRIQIEADGTRVSANIKRIDDELERRRNWVRKQGRVRTHQAPDEPEFEPEFTPSIEVRESAETMPSLKCDAKDAQSWSVA